MFEKSASFPEIFEMGTYRLDKYDNVTNVNEHWLKIHGFQKEEEIIGRNIKVVYARPFEATALRQRVISVGTVTRIEHELQRKNGEYFWGSIYSTRTTDKTGKYIGREGIIFDSTERIMHRKIMQDLPTGYYAVETRDINDVITFCNDKFAEMFGFESPQAAVGKDISHLYRHQADFEALRDRIQYGNEDTIRHKPEVNTIDGKKTFWIEATITVKRDRQNKSIGRIGIVRDLRQDEPFQDLLKDLGTVLHTFTTGFIALNSDIDVALETLSPDPYPRMPLLPNNLILNEMRSPVTNLNQSINNLYVTLSTQNQHLQLAQQLNNLHSQLVAAEHSQDIFRTQTIHVAAKQIMSTCQNALDNRIGPRQSLKQLRQAAFDVMRLFALARLRERKKDVLSMDHNLRSLRAFVTTPARTLPPQKIKFTLWTLVEQAMRNLYEFAYSSGVTFRPTKNPTREQVLADENEILRAITNLLHNAIKYSWKRPNGETWVEVNLFNAKRLVNLEIKNYGVPIASDEIESGLIYLFGFRSRHSTDRGRVGTGIGLADAYQTLKHYGGGVHISSQPASSWGRAENNDPFLTTVTMSMPTIY